MKKPLSRAAFARRFGAHFAWGALFVLGSLVGGMGPVDAPQTPGGKIFAGLYALYAGLVFLIFAGVLLVPVLHHLLHRFHWEIRDEK